MGFCFPAVSLEVLNFAPFRSIFQSGSILLLTIICNASVKQMVNAPPSSQAAEVSPGLLDEAMMLPFTFKNKSL